MLETIAPESGMGDVPQLPEAQAAAAFESPCQNHSPTPRDSRTLDPDDLLKAQVAENHKANRELRCQYAEKAFRLARLGLLFWVLALGLTGVVFAITGYQMLSDTIMIAITTGSTINVLAAFLGVIRGLFPNAANA